MINLQTPYQALSNEAEPPETPVDTGVVIHVPESRKSQWDLIVDLDEFFQKIYYYHQKHGLLNIFLQDLSRVFLFVFVIITGIGFFGVINDVLMDDSDRQMSILGYLFEKLPSYLSNSKVIWFILVPSGIVALILLVRVVLKLYQFRDIRNFFTQALNIPQDQLEDVTWHEVQTRVLQVQKDIQISINKLTELDIYQRILRFENYMVALVNKDLLPYKYHIPFLGDVNYFPKGFKYNLNILFFFGPTRFFAKNWQIKDEYKKYNMRQELSRRLSRNFVILGLINLLLCIPIFVWQILYFCFNYGATLKREPWVLSTRLWSQYARISLRHFNELDHELYARLGRAAEPAKRYLSLFSSPLMANTVKPFVFMWGAFLFILMTLEVLCERQFSLGDNVAHITILIALYGSFSALMPKEAEVRSPPTLMSLIIKNICYAPDHWRSKCHTSTVRNELSQLFPYRIEYVIGELLSPLITPLLLIACRNRSMEIVDFFRNFTVEVAGLGDVCSFANMDLRKHGNPKWLCGVEAKVPTDHQTKNGKAELSLMHFTLINPKWQPPEPAVTFLNNLKAKVSDAPDHHLYQSMVSLESLDQQYASLRNPFALDEEAYTSRRANQEGPHYPTSAGLLSNLQQASSERHSFPAIHNPTFGRDIAPHDYTAANLGASTLLMLQIHDDLEASTLGENDQYEGSSRSRIHPATLWQKPPSSSGEHLPLLAAEELNRR